MPLALRIGKIAIINFVVFAFLFEAVSLVAYGIKREEFFYTRDPGRYVDFMGENKRGALGGNFFKRLDMVIHPYFGYVERVERGKTNNHGFRNVSKSPDCCDFPFVPRDDQAVVGIFGGSVAGALGILARNDDYFRDKLKALPAFNDKEIVFLSFATGGYRQPQQVMILTYYLLLGQKFDVIVNVDGFNELVTAFHNSRDDIDISMPATDIWFNTARHIERVNMRSGEARGVVLAYHLWRSLEAAREAESCALASCFIVYKLLQGYHRMRKDAMDAEEPALWRDYTHFFLSLPHKRPEMRLRDDDLDRLFKKEADIWENSSRRMAALAREAGSLYVHLVQPTLLYVAGKRISPKNPRNPYGYLMAPLKTGYPRLIERIPGMRADGIAVADGTGMFDGVDGEIYADDCCHYNRRGMEILVDHVVGGIANALAHRRDQDASGTGPFRAGAPH